MTGEQFTEQEKKPTMPQNENKDKFGIFATGHQGQFSLFCFTCVRAIA